MSNEIELKLWNSVKQTYGYSKEEWLEIIDFILKDFKSFLKQDFQPDREIKLNIDNPQNPSFSQWIWTQEKGESPLSITWSALVMGDSVADEKGFEVYVILFLFDSSGDNRLRLKTGESFICFEFQRKPDDKGLWVNLGWFKDEYGTWEDIG
jgi:hypothetical protein